MMIRSPGSQNVRFETRIAVVVRDADLFARRGDDVDEILRKRRGKGYDPQIIDLVTKLGISGKDAEWDEVLASEPKPALMVQDIDHCLSVVADYVDLKSPWTRGHSRTVADLAEQAARLLGVTEDQVREVGESPTPSLSDRAGAVPLPSLGRIG